MEIIDENVPPPQRGKSKEDRNVRHGKIYLGIILLVIGVLWLMNNFNLLNSNIFDVVFSWQMLLVIIGGYLMSLKKWVAGGLVAGVGILYLLTEYFNLYIPVSKLILPLIIIVLGVSLLLPAYRK